jgi:hypothetical protein
MEWEEAKSKISNEISVGMSLNTPQSTLRKVLQTNHSCHKYNYNGEKGYLIRISNYDNNNLDIPWSMLEKCFYALKSPEGYNGKFFRKYFPKQTEIHGCHVHVVGMIFKRAGIADGFGRNYYLKK